MTPEARFQRIETDLAAVTATLRGVAESQQRQVESLSQLTATISRYVDSADGRMKRIEENLDGLIRAITAEHGNGKRKP
jgi:hypothetical protein